MTDFEIKCPVNNQKRRQLVDKTEEEQREQAWSRDIITYVFKGSLVIFSLYKKQSTEL